MHFMNAMDADISLECPTTVPPPGSLHSAEAPALPADYELVRWYAAYTSANHEKRVADLFAARDVEYFFPVYESLRKWKDRRVKLQLPLFPGYVFVRLPLRDRLKVLQVPGVASLVGFGGRAIPLPEEDMLRIRKIQELGACARPHPFLTAGKKVRVNSGPLQGLEGIIVKQKNSTRFVVSVELLQRSVSVDLGAAELEPLIQTLTRLNLRGANISDVSVNGNRCRIDGRLPARNVAS
jgi:transcription antitermination factor NusG